MIHCKRVRKEDLVAVRALAQQSAKFSIDDSLINNRDIAIQARDEDTGALAGFLWCGLMSGNELGYVDKFMVSKDFHNKQVGELMFKALLNECKKRKVKTFIGHILRDSNHDRVCKSVLKIGAGGHELPYTLAYVNVDKSYEELVKLGDI